MAKAKQSTYTKCIICGAKLKVRVGDTKVPKHRKAMVPSDLCSGSGDPIIAVFKE